MNRYVVDAADAAHLFRDVIARDHVRVTEQAERPAGDAQGTHRVEVVEDVDVLIEWSTVADLDEVVDDDGPLWERCQPLPPLRRQRRGGPGDRVPREVVEAVGVFEPGTDLVVITANERCGR